MESKGVKLAITSQGKDLDSALDPRFGRCNYFIIVNLDTNEFEAIPNESLMASGGAGVKSAEFVAGRDVDALITGNIGPNAASVLRAAGIKVYVADSGTVRDAINRYKAGTLTEVSCATVGSHFGMGHGWRHGHG